MVSLYDLIISIMTQTITNPVKAPEVSATQFDRRDYSRFQGQMDYVLSGIPSPESIDGAAGSMWECQDMLIGSLSHDEYVEPTLALYESMMLDLPYHPSTATDRAIGDAIDTARIIFYNSLPAIQYALDRRPDNSEIFKISLDLAAGDKRMLDQRPLVDFMLQNLRAALDSSGFTFAKEQAGLGLDVGSSIDLMAEAVRDYNYIFEEISDRGDDEQVKRAIELSNDVASDVSEVGKEFFSGLDMDYDSFRASWMQAFPRDLYCMYETENLKKMRDLEAQRPGICKELHERFSIKNFARYPNSLLLAQYDHRDDVDTPYGIMITAAHDYKGAFYYAQDSVAGFYSKLADLGYALRVYEAERPLSVPRRIIESATKYGKPDFGVLNAHGNPAEMRVGGGEKEDITKGDIKRLPIENMAKYMSVGMEWVLLSCSTGRSIRHRFFRRAVPSIAQTLSGKLPSQQFVAPTRDVSVEALVPILDKDGRIHIKPTFKEPNNEEQHDPRIFRAGALATRLS